MRTVLIASAGLALIAAGDADAQQRVVARGPGAGYGVPGRGPMPAAPMTRTAGARPATAQPGPRAPMIRPGMIRPGQPRWGSKIGGHWWGGMNAPGGWHAYRRPYRGWALPSYWIAPRFFVNDWRTYGLSQPAYGYNWVRYYDDAVLIDGRGSVYDSASGIDWDRYDDGYDAEDDAVYADAGDRGYDDRAYRRDHGRRDDGVGGAVTGAVVGGVAGNLIAGRGNRLGGTLIGAGVGAAAGYATDKGEDRRGPPVPAYGAAYDRPGYDVPVAPAYAPPPPRVVYGRSAPVWRSPDGGTTVTTTGGYGYAGGTTTVLVQSAPVVTTTTEVYEDAVTYTRAPAVHRKTSRVWRPAPRCACR